MLEVFRLDAAGLGRDRAALIELLQDSVAHGASVSYLPPLGHDDAARFWDRVAADPDRIVLGARRDGALIGTVQLQLASVPNGAHRAEVQKLLVHSNARRAGIARALMAALEGAARVADRTLLVLDTKRGDAAEALYRTLGWIQAGVIPDFARSPEGFCDTVIFYKHL